MATWNEQLRTARKQRRLTQVALAERAAVSVRTVTSYEGGAISPLRDTLLRLAQGLGLDRQTVNALLEAAGHDPLPTGRLADFERRSIPLTYMQQEIDRYTWPCLIVSDAVEILLWNPPAVWVGEFDFAAELPNPSDRSLVRITAMDHFQEPRVVNWTEIASTLIGVFKADFEDPDRWTAAIPWFAAIVQELPNLSRYRRGFERLMALWQTVAPKHDVARHSFRAEWQLSDGKRLSFDCLIVWWNDFEAFAAFDWFPANADTAAWLAARAAEAAANAQPSDGTQAPQALPAWNELLQIAREKCGFTQERLARAIDKSPETIYSYEGARRKLPRPIMLRMARAMQLDGATTNLILTGAGREPVAAEIARSVVGEPALDPRFPPSHWQPFIEPTRAMLPEKIAAHRWPCLVFDGQCQTLAANSPARRLLGSVPLAPSLLQVLISRSFREHVVNFDEVVSALAPRGLRRAVANGGANGRSPLIRSLLQELERDEPALLAELHQIWEQAPDSPLSTRATFPVVWRHDDGTLLNFDGVLGLWSDVLWYWALDFHPADAATWRWLGG